MNFIIKKLMNKKNMWFTILLFFIAFLILAGMAVISYKNDKKTIISQQEQQMLTIARLTCKTLEGYFGESSDNLNIIAKNHEVGLSMQTSNFSSIQSSFEAYYQAKKETVQRLYSVNQAGEIVFVYPTTNDQEIKKTNSLIGNDIQKVLKGKKTYIGNAKMEQSGQFVVYIYQPVLLDENLVGILISEINLNAVYEQLIKPVKVGHKGYVMVKDKKGIILMHPVKDQIGMNVISTREKVYPDLDFKELHNLVKMQMTQEEGAMTYHSYWWTDLVLEKTMKINAFSRTHISNFFWVIAVTMDYDEVEGPIAQNRIKTIIIFSMIALILSSAIFIILKIQKNKESLEVETKYLKELNAAMGELRNKDLQLQHSQKLQVIGTLTGGIAHEFNNLLTPIMGYTEILRSRKDFKDEVYDYIDEIHEASGKAKNIIEQILVFSRSDSGKSKFTLLNLSPLIEETIKLVKSTFTPNVKIIFEKSDEFLIFANNVQIYQIIYNLSNNAFQSMKYTGGIIKLTMDYVSTEEVKNLNENMQCKYGYVRISVKDTGYGMNKETISKIFDPFFTTKSIGEGTGLGLFVVYGIVENHKGFITVDSEIGKGSTFTVYFPRSVNSKIEDDNEIQEFPKDIKNVLLVDDNPKILKVLKKGLEQFYFKVTTNSNSVEALKIFENNPVKFDVIITDQTMPYLKGLEMAERMKILNPEIKIILVTGFADDKVMEYKERLIIDTYLIKPVTGEGLSKEIRKLLWGV